MLHVPHSCRLCMIAVVAQCWNGIRLGIGAYAQAEEARPRLLLGPCSVRAGSRRRALKRITLWRNNQCEEFVQRTKQQCILLQRSRKRWSTRIAPDSN